MLGTICGIGLSRALEDGDAMVDAISEADFLNAAGSL